LRSARESESEIGADREKEKETGRELREP